LSKALLQPALLTLMVAPGVKLTLVKYLTSLHHGLAFLNLSSSSLSGLEE